jgi:hypothetical protein
VLWRIHAYNKQNNVTFWPQMTGHKDIFHGYNKSRLYHNKHLLWSPIRPCIRWNFPNFLFSCVSEMFSSQNSKKFWKKEEFLNLQNFRKKFWKKVQILTKIVCQFQKFWKNYVKFEFLSQNPIFGSKSLEKVQKSLETGFSKCSEISEIVLFQTFQKLWKNDVQLELWKFS